MGSAEVGVLDEVSGEAPPRPTRISDFALVWTGTAISTLGTRTLAVAYPLLALVMTNSPTAAGWTGFALTIPILIFYVPGGVLVDRMRSRRVMILAEAVRGLAVVSVFLAVFFGGPSLLHLMTAAFLEGMMWVFYSLAETVLLPTLVETDRMERALGKSETATHLASLFGRPLGGYLFGLNNLIPFALNAVLFMISSVLTVFTVERRAPRPSVARSPMLRDLSEGFRALNDEPFLRGALAVVTFTNLMINSLIMIFIAGSHGLSSLMIGLVLAAGGVGGALGALAAIRLVPPRSMLLIHMWVWVVALMCAAVGAFLDVRPLFFGLALFITGVAGALSNVSIRTVEVDRIAPKVLARVVGVSRLASQGAVCLAAPFGGFLVSSIGVEFGVMALFVAMLGMAVLVTCMDRLRKDITPSLSDARGIGSEHAGHAPGVVPEHAEQALDVVSERVDQASRVVRHVRWQRWRGRPDGLPGERHGRRLPAGQFLDTGRVEEHRPVVDGVG
jgi:predicted MFS family arabinose efflux permease